MKDRATTTARSIASATRMDAMRDGVDAAVPLVRRLASDRRLREALRDLVDAGREVADEMRRDGGRLVARDMMREGALRGDIQSSARALHGVADRMARARSRTRRRRTMRMLAILAAMGGAGYAAWRAVQGTGRSGGQQGQATASGNGAMYSGPVQGSTHATSRPAGMPTPGA